MRKYHLITIFPNILDSYFNESLFNRAQKNKLCKIITHNLRDFTNDKHQTVDDKPYGGGVGLVFKIEPIYKALCKIIGRQKNKKIRVILTAANGKKFTQQDALRLSKYQQLIFVCPRYEGVDARVEKLVDEKFSIGDYVLAGGELAAAVMIEAVARYLPGFVGKKESVMEDSHKEKGYLEYPQYTRPEIFITKTGKKMKVPKILLSGNHAEIAKWRQSKTKRVL